MRNVCAIVLVLFLAGCQATQYYWQATTGHMRLIHKRQPISEVLKSSELTDKERHKFKIIRMARNFASKDLHLKVAKHYSTYIPIDSENVVWSVYALSWLF